MSLLKNDKTETRPVHLQKVVMALAAGMLAVTVAAAPPNNAEVHWKMDCAKCHGPTGRGNTAAGRYLGAGNFQDPKVQASFTDEQAFKAIKEGLQKDGRMKMRPFGSELTDQDIRDLVQHVRSFKKGK